MARARFNSTNVYTAEILSFNTYFISLSSQNCPWMPCHLRGWRTHKNDEMSFRHARTVPHKVPVHVTCGCRFSQSGQRSLESAPPRHGDLMRSASPSQRVDRHDHNFVDLSHPLAQFLTSSGCTTTEVLMPSCRMLHIGLDAGDPESNGAYLPRFTRPPFPGCR